MTITEQLVAWAWSLDTEGIPEHVKRAACRHLLDGTGAAIAAARRGAAGYAVEVANQFPAPPEATVIGSGTRIAAPAAALANGTLTHALDYDDTHAKALVHPTAVVLPAAFAVGEQMQSSGREVLTAAICGYETITRLGTAVPHAFHARGFHATSVCGVFGAALVAARLGGLRESQAVDALGIAGSMSSGLLEFLNTGSGTKQFHPGWAAMSGVIAARLAGAGGSGPATVLEGSYGLYRAYAGVEARPAEIFSGLGTQWETTAITIKPYPACQLSHATLDAVLGMRGDVSIETVESVVCTIPEQSVPIVFEPIENKLAPRNEYEAKFSLPWSAAALLIDGELGVDSFEADKLARLDILELARKITYRPWNPGVAAAAAPGKAEIHLRNGRTITNEVSASRGGPGIPLTDAELAGKFFDNCGGTSDEIDELRAKLLSLEEQEDLTKLLATAKPTALVGTK